jgi:hypothetical protein
MSNSQKVTFYANFNDFRQNIQEVYRILTSEDKINTLSSVFIKLISTIWKISESRINSFNVLACVDSKNCSTTLSPNSNTIQFSFIVSDTISEDDISVGYRPNDYISAVDLGPWMVKTFNLSTGSISSDVSAPILTESKYITAAKSSADLTIPPTLDITNNNITISQTFGLAETAEEAEAAETAETAEAAEAAETAETAEAAEAAEAAVAAVIDIVAGSPTDTPAEFTNISAAKILKPFANVRPFSLLLNKHSEYFSGATSTAIAATNTTGTTGTTTDTKSTPPATSEPASSSRSILDYVFQYSYLISFIGAIAFSISEVIGYNPIEVFHSKVLIGYYVFTMFCAIMSLFAWFNISIWYVDTSIINPLNVSTSNPWW